MKIIFYCHEPQYELIETFLLINKQFEVDPINYELVIVLGGDGLFLQALKEFAFKDVKLILINNGNLGFFAHDLNLQELSLSKSNFTTYPLLSMQIDNSNEYFCFNEFLLTTKNNPLSFNVALNNNYWYTFTGSGFVVSTKNGSTGLNRTLNGPLIYSDDLYIYQEFLPVKSIKTRSLNQSLVLSKDEEMNFTINVDYLPELFLKIDGITQKFNSKNIKIKLHKSIAKIYKLNLIEWSKNINKKLLDK